MDYFMDYLNFIYNLSILYFIIRLLEESYARTTASLNFRVSILMIISQVHYTDSDTV